MKLTDLDAKLITITEDHGIRSAETLAEAHGVRFLCPQCFAANGGPERTHAIVILFTGRSPLAWAPAWKRWDVTGSSLDDLTLSPSVHVVEPCGWHGWVRGGDAA